MPKTVNEGFLEFHRFLTPSEVESDAAKKHRASIKECLESNLEVTRFWRTGSFGNGTSIRIISDVDYFTTIPDKHIRKNSATMLRVLRDVLIARFPTTKISVRTPAVRLEFADGSESTEIVPSYLKDVYKDEPLYLIPAEGGEWQKSCPDLHLDYVNEINKSVDHKLKPLVRFIKAWKYFRAVPLSSFFLELYVARHATERKSILYSGDVALVLTKLLANGLTNMNDPTGVSGYVTPCPTDSMKDDALSKLETAAKRAQDAFEAETGGNTREAYRCWNLVFKDFFPSYS